MNKNNAIWLTTCFMMGLGVSGTSSSEKAENNNRESKQNLFGQTFGINDRQNISLPISANNNAVINIHASDKQRYLDTSNTNVAVEAMTIDKGQNYSFRFNYYYQIWELVPNNTESITSNSESYVIPDLYSNFYQMHLRDGTWARQITLPRFAPDGAYIQVISEARENASLSTSNLLFPSSYTIKNGDDFWFRYNSRLAKWVPERIKPSVLTLDRSAIAIPAINAPVTEIIVPQGILSATLALPRTAKDRDRLIIRSIADSTLTLSNTFTNTQATLKLKNTSRYEFMYVIDQAKWVLISAPELILRAAAFQQEQIPAMEQPTTRIRLTNANRQTSLNLPLTAKIGDRVIISSAKDANVTIRSSRISLNQPIQRGETQRYKFTASGWAKDSSTLDLLMVSSREVVGYLGEYAARVRMYEGQDLTNIAAENSNAQFYMRPASYLTYSVPYMHTFFRSGAIEAALRFSTVDRILDRERSRVAADMVYYEGFESEACGMAWINDIPQRGMMFGVGNVNCPTYTMRHELGHNLGLDHHDANNSRIARGFYHVLGSTIMAWDRDIPQVPYYSSPDLFHPKYGYRLGASGHTDAVNKINMNAPIIAGFY